MRRFSLRILVLLAIVTACASSRRAKSPDEKPDAAEAITAYCHYLSTCGAEWLSQFPGGTEQGCQEAVRCTGLPDSLPSKQCTASREARCQLLAALGLGCDVEDLPQEGEPCVMSMCGLGLQCSFHEGCSTCERAPELGESCAHHECDPFGNPQCERGRTFCDAQSDTCQPLRKNGEPCSSAVECEAGTCVSRVCGPVGLEGEPCSGWSCAGYLTCRDEVCAPRGREGERCGGDGPFCQSGLACVQQACVPALCADEQPQVGSPCPDPDVGCGEGMYCKDDRCAAALPLDAPCMPRAGSLAGLAMDECGPSAYCSAEALCKPRLGAGEECGTAIPCGANLGCWPEGCDELCRCSIDDSTRFACRAVAQPQACE